MAEKHECGECGSQLDVQGSGCSVCQLRLGLGATKAMPSLPPILEPEELSKRFEDLEVLELIGAGGMGAVYSAKQTKLDRIVALKVIRPDISTSDEFALRFEREAKALARLNHPNIVSIYDFGNQDGLFYCLMEYVDGTDLAELAKGQQLSAAESLEIVTQVSKAIQFAHDQGVVHRDIKPTNILFNSQGDVKIADFGLAKLRSNDESAIDLTQTRQVFGTPKYMAPEQVEASREVDHRADIYSLGVVFYELLTGELPMGRFDPPSKKISIDVRLDEVVLRALEKHPERRYQTARDVHTDISRIVTDPVPPTKSTSAAVPIYSKFSDAMGQPGAGSATTNIRPSPKIILFILTGVLLLGCGIFFFTLSMAMLVLPYSQRWMYGILIWVGAITLFLGGSATWFGLKLRMEQLSTQRDTSVFDKILTYRGLCYGMFACLGIAFAVPWFNYSHLMPYAFGSALHSWPGAFMVVWSLGFLLILVLVDLIEGIKIKFAALMIFYGVGMWCAMRLQHDIPNLGNLMLSHIPGAVGRKSEQVRFCGGMSLTIWLNRALFALGVWWFVSRLARVQITMLGDFLRRKLLD